MWGDIATGGGGFDMSASMDGDNDFQNKGGNVVYGDSGIKVNAKIAVIVAAVVLSSVLLWRYK